MFSEKDAPQIEQTPVCKLGSHVITTLQLFDRQHTVRSHKIECASQKICKSVTMLIRSAYSKPEPCCEAPEKMHL